eukprot:gene8238-11148_t
MSASDDEDYMEEQYEEDDNANQTNEEGIAKPMSAYHQYSKEYSSKVKEELLREGKETALGAIVSIVATRWKNLPQNEKAYYENLAKEDRNRYNKECAIRDEEFLKQQEERRKAHEYVETDTRMRGSTLAYTEYSTQKSEAPRRKREYSERELEIMEKNKMVKKAEEKALKEQQADLKATKAEQAEARLKFLLAQSDIFSHFGAVKGMNTSNPSESSAPVKGKGRGRPSGSSGRPAVSNQDELDDDEKAMAKEVEDEEEEGNTSSSVANKKESFFLLKQPSIISGGAMRNYQLDGLNWMIKLQENGINGILADEMGLGKTLQSISILAFMKEFRDISGPHLIMVPKSTLSNWINELKKWCPSLRPLRFHGSKEERAEIAEQLKPGKDHSLRPWDVVVTTYEVVNLEKSVLTKIAWRYLIIDEAHRLKNEASQFSQTVRLLQTEYRLLLTGTPLQNNLHELWALLNFLLPDVFASSEQFDDWFNLDVEDSAAKERIISQLHKLLRPFMLRRLKVEVEKSLPPKSETILFTGMSAVQKNVYRQVLLRDIDAINGAGNTSGNGSRTAILNIVMQLRKCCNHPYLFPGVEDRTLDPMGDHLYMNCGKMVLLDKLLMKMKQRGHRVLIFSQMTRMLDILEDYLISKGYFYCRIDGNTSYEDREDRIADFNRPDSDKFIFILSTRAGGLGINLQTADTVILYDSDWNPQADLQAQDRAHRIGQKKPVQVFRLVTDETVEVKVVERAQQKLKLDAMVVQQGRLQDKEKKLTKQDLLETLRFGADKVFRSKESTITDADIDLILEEGRKRTEEMNEKLQIAQKGDMYDFRLDGGMSTQVFEGKDYSDKNLREQEKELNALASLQFIDPGKRDRKAIATYSETIARATAAEEADKKQKLPRHLRLNKMEDFQFFDRDRLNELQAEELRLFDLIVERGEAPQAGNVSKFVVLPPQLHEEKTRLLSEAFGEWTRVHFNNFIRATAKHGRNEFDKISKDVGKAVDETTRYAKVFWDRGPVVFPQAEWDRYTKQIEKGEKRLEEITRLTAATAKLIMMYDDPWEELTFKNVGNVGRTFNAMEDRYLLCLTHLHGYGSWEQIRNSVRRCERFRFDFYLQSCSAEALGKRCELLMKSAERELIEIERKRQTVDTQSFGTVARLKAAGDHAKDKLNEITKQISDESRRLANARSQLAKLKATANGLPTTTTESNGKSSTGTGANVNDVVKAPPKTKPGPKAKVPPSDGSAPTQSKGPGQTANVVPEGIYPELCKLLVGAGQDGVTKVVAALILNHPNISKRQAEITIDKLAVKEKRAEDAYKVWHVKPEYEKFLRMENYDKSISAVMEDSNTAAATSSAKKTTNATVKNPSSTGKSSNNKSNVNTSTSTPKVVKRKRDDKNSSVQEDYDDDEQDGVTGLNDSSQKLSSSTVNNNGNNSALKEPKKYKRAFGFFVKSRRGEAEMQLGDYAG